MKSVWIALLSLGILIATWGIYDTYSDRTLNAFIQQIGDDIIVSVMEEEWESARTSFDRLSGAWNDYKKCAAFFFDRSLLNETDYAIAKAKYFIRAEDVSNASGELGCLIEQLTFLHSNQSIHIENIF